MGRKEGRRGRGISGDGGWEGRKRHWRDSREVVADVKEGKMGIGNGGKGEREKGKRE